MYKPSFNIASRSSSRGHFAYDRY